jgi:hypothetical protein
MGLKLDMEGSGIIVWLSLEVICSTAADTAIPPRDSGTTAGAQLPAYWGVAEHVEGFVVSAV